MKQKKRNPSTLLITLALLWGGFLLQSPAYALTLGTWNVMRLGWGDARDWDRTAKVIAPYDFVALQEVMTPEALGELERRLEDLTGEEWSSLGSDVAVGRGRYRELYAFMWREQAVDYAGGAVLYLDPGDRFAREPFAARFKTDDGRLRWTAASIHIIYGDGPEERRQEVEQLQAYWQWLEENIAEGDPVLLMGDFNLKPDEPAFGTLKRFAQPAVRQGASTLSSRNGRFANLYDNIWHSPTIQPSRCWIDKYPVRLGLTHEEARARISDHAPVGISWK